MESFEARVARGILGLDRDAGPGEVRRAARRLALSHHPDMGGSTRNFKRVVWARDLLLRAG